MNSVRGVPVSIPHASGDNVGNHWLKTVPIKASARLTFVEHTGRPVSAMKIEVIGQIFPKVWEIARSVKKLREERRIVNIGSGTMGTTVYEVEFPEGTKKEGIYLVTPHGPRLYWHPGSQYESGYIISELDNDELAMRHFKK